MATRTPTQTTTTESPGTGRSLLEFANDPPRAVTGSRAVRPTVVVPNKRLVDEYGEAYLTWRCDDCGALGTLDAFPSRCGCGAGREHLYYERED